MIIAKIRRVSDSHRMNVADFRTLPTRNPTPATPRPPSPDEHIERSLPDDMFATKGTNRRERTFVGSFCAACEEPLEHILRGERILQLSCGHVSHEACFYEFIREFDVRNCPICDKPLGFDTSRGGNVDFDNLNRLVRSTHTPDLRERPEDVEAAVQPWESDEPRRSSTATQKQLPPQRISREHLRPGPAPLSSHPYERYSASHTSNSDGHGRHPSADTAPISDYADSHHASGRRHDYDVQSMEASLASPRRLRLNTRNPIPAPIVTVRSEFPTINKSRHQQSLTCLVTVEVVEGKWRPHPEELRSPPPLPSPAREQRFEQRKPRPVSEQPVDSVHEDNALEETKEELYRRVDNWHGLDFDRFGRLIIHGIVRVGKDKQTWQELECYLFSEVLICVKEKKIQPNGSQPWQGRDGPKPQTRCTLKGSIIVKKHLSRVETSPEGDILTLSLSVVELPAFHLQFQDRTQLGQWRKALININRPTPLAPIQQDLEQDFSGTDEDEYTSRRKKRVSSVPSSYGANRSQATAPTEYSNSPAGGGREMKLGCSLHIPLDIVVVVPVTSSMQGLKINLLRETLRFLLANLGERDRMGLVAFGAESGGVPLVGMTTKSWGGWGLALSSIRPIGSKNVRADVVDGANVAVDLLMQRKSANPLSNILLISDSSTSDPDSVDFVASRAEAAKIGIYSFGLGLTHKPDTMVEMATRTKASYMYVKDWLMLRECVAGCLGSMQSTSHQNVRVRLRLPEGSPAKFVKISGALQVTKRATGRDAEASLGDMRFGDKRDILVQLAIQPDNSTPESVLADAWENMVSSLEALGSIEQEESRAASVEELPILQAELVQEDVLLERVSTQLARPSLLAITMLPAPSTKAQNGGRPTTPSIPPHPSVVQRRMELLTSDMLTRALSLVSRGQNDRAHHLLAETRSILKGLGKGGLPPLPTPPPTAALPPTPTSAQPWKNSPLDPAFPALPTAIRTPSPGHHETTPLSPTVGIDRTTMIALDSELETSLEWIRNPTVFGRDTRKSVLQAIGVISSQRGYTFRSPSESLWAKRVPGIRCMAERSLEWREVGDDALMEETESSTTGTQLTSYPTQPHHSFCDMSIAAYMQNIRR
ncbi:uncharacterized protein MYCFIDRAFT_173848 [Pseudocercospora fijiensis CIRAD86]|uniref:RING-type domain-containing protein n=1 Tax=Pseudocercospora fijiensis (strain CIRAD86) TaxID=383855 RepID=M3AK59_PSEFD|nr:uncharacterized protein MYCFIDRAFT_173848 [Pseudocercospora fijiensis CIRAD86]EME84966.1 hypothetical protein MYCFIDRAFT_173848 [Pseudocercospora fijiensis CIRAD86]